MLSVYLHGYIYCIYSRDDANFDAGIVPTLFYCWFILLIVSLLFLQLNHWHHKWDINASRAKRSPEKQRGVRLIIGYLTRLCFWGFFPGILGVLLMIYAWVSHYLLRFNGRDLASFLSHIYSLPAPVGVTLFKVLWGDFSSYSLSAGMPLILLTLLLGKTTTGLLNHAIPYIVELFFGKRGLYVWDHFTKECISLYRDKLLIFMICWWLYAILLICVSWQPPL